MSDLSPETLIDAYFAGQLDAADAERVRAFLGATPSRRGFVAGVHAAIHGEDIAPLSNDVETATRMLIARIRGEHAERHQPMSAPVSGSVIVKAQGRIGRPLRSSSGPTFLTQLLRRYVWYGAASAVVVGFLIVAGWTGAVHRFGRRISPVVDTYITRDGRRAIITLMDGSSVVLYDGSRLEVPEDYASGHRTVRLVGEALFTVSHHDRTPFAVLSGPTVTRALGTSFVVRRYRTDTATTVAVDEGKVNVGTAILSAAQSAVIGPSGIARILLAGGLPLQYGHQLLTAASLRAGSNNIAQSAASQIVMGDREYAALHPAVALAHYTAAIAVAPNSVDALWKASRASETLGEFSDSTSISDSLYRAAESYGRRAVAIDSMNANAQFALAQALGQIAATIDDPQAKLTYGLETYRHVRRCLTLNPSSAECADILGCWNAYVMDIDAKLRRIAIDIFGASELSDASWATAEQYLQRAVAEQPKSAAYHLDLARTYADMGNKTRAKAEYHTVLQAPVMDYNDQHYKAEARKALKDLGDG
jgi:hypothetical protein